MTISVGGTPVIPPNIKPLPPKLLLKYSEAIKVEVAPTISPIARTTAKQPPSSRRYSKDKAVIFF
ncbi:hypothetical protein D3C87_1677720 [compost metagenome]